MRWIPWKAGCAASRHPEAQDLLRFLDGELPSAQAARVESHLAACWECRARKTALDRNITSYMEQRVSETGDFASRLRTTWPELRARMRKSQAASESRVRPLLWRRAAIAASVCSIAVFGAMMLWRPRSVSAAELIDRATRTEQAVLSRVSEPVVHRTIRVRSQRRPAAIVEVWHDRKSGRSRKSGDASLVSRLDAIAAVNGPLLSASSVASWRDRSDPVNESVLQVRLDTGERAWELRTKAASAVREDGIESMAARFRESDSHLVEQTIRVREAHGPAEYTLSEVTFDVVARSSLPPEVLGGSEPKAGNDVSPAAPVAPLLDNRPPIASLLDVLEALHAVGACRGEQVSAARADSGLVRVTGVVETGDRRDEITRAIAAAGLASVELRVPQATPIAGVGAGTEAPQAPQRGGLDRLLPSRSPAEIASMESEALDQSDETMSNAWALRRLDEFTEGARLSPDEVTRVQRMQAEHATAMKRSIDLLQATLRPILEGVSATPGPGSGTLWSHAAEMDRYVKALCAGGSAQADPVAAASRLADILVRTRSLLDMRERRAARK